jgi:chemotaxis protein methyltransferase CheR
MDDRQLQELLDRFGLSWRGYRKVRKGVKKRIRRHMHQLKCQNLEKYFFVLDRDDESRQYCERLMTVSISRFFRDRILWERLEEEILPSIIHAHGERVRVWSAGCACGEEVYSLKIIWNQIRDRFESMPYLEIWATDMHPVYLDRARDGIYSLSSLRDIPDEIRSTYFEVQMGGDRHRVVSSIKQGIQWKVHNFLYDWPRAEFHLIFLRNNLLTYYNDDLKGPAFRKVVGRLASSGFLIIGSHERIPFEMRDLKPFRRYQYILQKS